MPLMTKFLPGGISVAESSTDSHVSKAEEFFLKRILSHFEPTRENRVSLTSIATASSVTPDTARYLLEQLNEKGFVHIVRVSELKRPPVVEVAELAPDQELIINLTDEGKKVL